VKILVFGKDGQVGRELRAALPDAVALGRAEADFEHPEGLGPIIRSEAPAVIVNAAAYTNVDAAEADRQRAWTVNAAAVGAVGEAARAVGASVIHFSTDYVFEGSAAGPQDETTPTSPLNVYGASKLAGEALLRDSGAACAILRTSWVYAAHGRNFPLTILRLAREREALEVVADQRGAPTSAALIAQVTVAVAADLRPGVYHLAAAGETSWHGLATYLVAAARAAGAALRLAPEAIRPIPASAYAARAPRPPNSLLDTHKLRSTYGVGLEPWQTGIDRLVTTLGREGRL
jgi:dTDP-4-dehydrorhamnose reductase